MSLAPGQDGGRNFVDFRGGKYEKNMGRGLFKGLEQGIEGSHRKHVDFINDIDFVPGC